MATTATVVGTLSDFGLKKSGFIECIISFTPTGPGVVGGRLLSARPVTVEPDSEGSFEIDLLSTLDVTPDVWYEVQIRWLESADGYAASEFLSWRLNVPPEGGYIGDLLDIAPGANDIWIGPKPPTAPKRGMIWIDTSVTPPVLNVMES